MTKLQQNKRFVLTIVIIEILTALITASIFGFLYFQSYSKKTEEASKLNSQLEKLVEEEKKSIDYIKTYEISSDLKKSNTIILNNFQTVASENIRRVSNLNPFLNLNFIELIESNEYLNVVDIKFSISLKDENLDSSFIKIYSDILLKAFENSIESKQFYNLRQISEDTFIVTYQKKIEGEK